MKKENNSSRFQENHLKLVPANKLVWDRTLEAKSGEKIDFIADTIDTVSMAIAVSVVGPDEEGKFYVIDGAKRVSALEKLYGKDVNVPCYIASAETSEWHRKMLKLLANMPQTQGDRGLWYFECVQLYAERYGNDCHLTRKISDNFPVTDRYCREFVKMLKAGSPETIQFIERMCRKYEKLSPLKMNDFVITPAKDEAEQKARCEAFERTYEKAYAKPHKSSNRDFIRDFRKEFSVDDTKWTTVAAAKTGSPEQELDVVDADANLQKLQDLTLWLTDSLALKQLSEEQLVEVASFFDKVSEARKAYRRLA